VSGERSELYVYYRVAPSNWRVALRVVHDFQRRLRSEHPGLATRVLKRAADGSEGVTLMEIYAFADDQGAGVDSAMRSRIENAATALAPLLASPRQIEVFNALN